MDAIKNMTPSKDEMESEEGLQEIVAKQVAPNLSNILASSLRYEGEIEEMRALGLGDRSFIDNNHQFENHHRRATNSLQSKVIKRKCEDCKKGFVDGVKRKSVFRICINCSGQVHEKCVINKKIVQFKCRKCNKALEVANGPEDEDSTVPEVANEPRDEDIAVPDVANGPETENSIVQEVANDSGVFAIPLNSTPRATLASSLDELLLLLGTVESAKPAESLQADIANTVIEDAKKTDFQMSKEVNTKEAEDVPNKKKGADDEMVLEKEVDNTEKSLWLQLEHTIVFPESANSPDAENIQEDIADKIPEADVAKETDVQMSKEVNTKEAEYVFNKNKGADDEFVLAKEVDNTETSVCLQLEDTIVLPESANPPDAENIQEVNNKEAEDCLNTSDSNMNMNKVSEKVGEEEVEESVSLVLEDTIVLPIYVKKRKREALNISILLEESSIKDIDGLSTRKGKCQRMRGWNINLK